MNLGKKTGKIFENHLSDRGFASKMYNEFLKLNNKKTKPQGMEKRETSYTVGGNANCATSVENSLEVPYKTENRVTIWSNKSIPEHITRNMKALIKKVMCMPMFIASLFTIAKMWKQIDWPSTYGWQRGCGVIMEYYSAINKNETLPFVATWMDLENTILS